MEIAIFDTVGRKVYSEKRNKYMAEEVIDVRLINTTSGMYVIEIRVDQEIVVENFFLSKY